MNIKQLMAAAATILAAGSVFAQQTYPYVDFNGCQSTKTRAEVVAELQQSEADGSYDLAHQDWVDPAAGFVSTKSRAQVIAELEQSKADGSYDLAHQEYEGQVPVQQRGRQVSTGLAQGGTASHVN